MRRPMFYVLAGDAREAAAWARDEGLDPGQWRYLSCETAVRGLRIEPGTVARVGTFWARKDAGDIERAVRIASAGLEVRAG